MRIAVTFEDGKVGQHFGRTEKFKVYEIDDGKIKSSQVMDTNGAGHSELVSFLRASEVEAVICGGIGMGARNAIEELGIALFLGVDGDADTVVNGYLGGKLNFKSKEICSHHNHDGEHHCHGGNTNDECGSGCHR